MEMFQNDDPVLKIERITDNNVLKDARSEISTDWDVFCDVYYALNCPDDTGKYQIKLKWGEYEGKTTIEKSQNAVCEWYAPLQIANVKFPYRSSSELPDVFLYLEDDNKPICYHRWTNKEVFVTNQFP